MAKSLDDILNDDEFGLLEAEIQKTEIKTDEDRLIESFEEINDFFREEQPRTQANIHVGICLVFTVKRI